MQRAALYIRVSTEEQARHGLSLEDQKNNLIEFAKSHGMKIAGIYEDAGISARKPYTKRPALLRLLDDCRAKKVDIILFINLETDRIPQRRNLLPLIDQPGRIPLKHKVRTQLCKPSVLKIPRRITKINLAVTVIR